MLGLVTKVSAGEVVDLGGGTVEKNASDFKDAYNGKTITNGTVTLTAAMGTNTGTYTIGNGAVVQCKVEQNFNGDFAINIVDGGEYKQTGSFFCLPFRYGNVSLTMDGGKFTCTSTSSAVTRGGVVNFGYVWNNQSSTKNQDVSASVVMKNESELSLSSGNLQLSSAKSDNEAGSPLNTISVDFAVTNSSIKLESGQLLIGSSYSDWIYDHDASYVKAIFGPGSDLTLNQIYVYPYPSTSVVFDGATIHYAGTGSNSFIGQNSGLEGDIFEVLSGGVAIDIPSDVTLIVDGRASSFKGEGGVTKIGEGNIVWNNINAQTSGSHLFTGPLVVSNGMWTSTKNYAASALRADGGTLVLSGTLSASDVELAATEGGTLTLTGATITDAAPSLTLAGGGTTDYFTRDAAVDSYSIGTLTLGPGAVLDLDADSTGMDAISASSTNITATAESPITVNMNFSVAPSTGQTFTFFEVDSADVISINAKVGDLSVLYEKSIVDGRLVMTVSADDYTWNGTKTNWGDTDAWTKNDAAATWSDGNNAIFATANAQATLAADVVASKVSFTADATIGGTATLTAPEVSVDSGVSATISAATSSALVKTGTGTLTFGSSRTEQTTVTEGTLAVSNGATLDSSKLTLGTDATKPVVFDYGGQTISANPQAYIAAGMDVTLTNGTFTTTINPGYWQSTAPKTLTIAKDAVFSTTSRYTWNSSSTQDEDVTNVINIVGGTMKSEQDGNNWIMQNSRSGTLKFNVSEGGLLEFGGRTHMLNCRDDTTENDTPRLYMTFNDSTFRVANNKNLMLGHDDESKKKNPKEPILELAMTNSVLDVGTGGIILGYNKRQSNTDGYAKAWFSNCVITTGQFSVYYDRPLNGVCFNNARLVETKDFDYWIEVQESDDIRSEGITVEDGGLILDNQTFNGTLRADFKGTGAVTKVGAGKLTVARNQTGSATFNVNEGEVFVNGGLSIERPIAVKSSATFSVQATAQSEVESLSLESGSTLNIATYTAGVVPLSLAELTLPESGTVALTIDGNAFPVGKYQILEKSGITPDDVQDILVPSTGSVSYSYSVSEDTLFLTVGTPAHGRWIAYVGSGDFSNQWNWEDSQVPRASEALDFSGAAGATVNCDLSDVTFGAVKMGDGVVTFTGSLTATSFSDTSKVAVGKNSTVTLDGDLKVSGSTDTYIVYSVAEGGRFVITGNVTATAEFTGANLYPTLGSCGGKIVANGLVANQGSSDAYTFRIIRGNASANWVVGAGGMSGSKYFWFLNCDYEGVIQPLDSDFAITTCIGNRANLTFNTTGEDDNPHVITIGEGGSITRDGIVNITGSGKVVIDYNGPAVHPTCSLGFNVKDAATLALNGGADLGTGALSLESGATLEVAESATFALGGSLALKSGSKLAFNFTGRSAPVLDMTGKTVAFTEAETTNVIVKVSAADALRPMSGKRQLTAGYDFTGVNVSLAEGAPEWVKNIGLDDDGNIVIDVEPEPFVILVR